MRSTLAEAGTILFTRSSLKVVRALGVDPPSSLEKALDRVGKITIDYRAFVDVLNDVCRGHCTGFGFAVFEGDNAHPFASGGHGLAVVANGSVGNVPFEATTRLNVHSMSKTITAAVITRALYLNETVSLHSAIGPFLRPDWNIREDSPVRNITFKQLLVHNSGLADVADDIPTKESLKGVKQALQKLTLVPAGQREYTNCNFSLCRMLLPYIDNDGRSEFTKSNLNRMPEATFNERTIQFFIDYVHKYFFAPLGLPGELQPQRNGKSPFTRYYDFDDGDPEAFDPNPTDMGREFVGASSWFMSAVEYGQFITGLRYRKIFGRPGEQWSPWETICDFDHRTKPGDGITYRLGVHEIHVGLKDPLVAVSKSGGGGQRYGPTNGWIAFSDLTAVLLINSMGGRINQSYLPPDSDPVELGATTALRIATKNAITRA